MNKSDLKDGMIVKLRNGEKEIVFMNKLYGMYGKNLNAIDDLNSYNKDLYHTLIEHGKNLDIIKVSYDNKILWEREEIDWRNVPVGTKVLVSDCNKNWHEEYFVRYETQSCKFKTINDSNAIHNWKYCKLIENSKEITKEELKKEYLKFLESIGCNIKYYEEDIDPLLEWLLF